MLVKRWEAATSAAKAVRLARVAVLFDSSTQALARLLAQRLTTEGAVGDVRLFEGGAAPGTAAGCDGWIDLIGCGQGVLHDLDWTTPLREWIDAAPRESRLALCITRGLESYRNDIVNLRGADRAGLYRMLSSEYGHVTSRHVDMPGDADDAEVVARILAECAASHEEVQVCYRDERRYRAVLEELPSDDLAALGAGFDLSGFRADHALLITGGTRGIGYRCAQHFVSRYGVRRLVLCGREPLPPREQWDARRDEVSATGEKIRAMLALEAQGAQVEVLAATLSDELELTRNLQHAKAKLGPIAGVIHCAGLVDAQEPAWVRKRVETMANVLEPKVKGLDTLLHCLDGEPLRFVLLFSSVSAAVPALAVGQSDYAMANAYMDYLAEAYAQRLPIVSIQWPSWKESGMGESRSTVYQGLGFLSHSDAQGLTMLDAILARKPSAVVLPALVDAQRWQTAVLTQPRIRQVPLGAPGQQVAQPQANRVAHRPDETDAAVLHWLTELLARELKLDPSRVDARTPLADYGVDSVMLVQLLKPVSERVGEALDPSILFEYPTLGQFAGWLIERHAGAFASAEQRAEESAKQLQSQAQPQPQPLRAAVAEPVVEVATVAMNEARETRATDIAVIGMSCRFPGADDLAAFWSLLAQGRSALRRVPPARWGASSDYIAGVLDRATYFDRAFFSISAEDARAMDPQALLALEQALALWYAGGYRMEEIKGRAVGVYLGARAQVVADAQTLRDAHNPIMAVGANYMAANISRFFDLHGPSVVVDTACSSALVAMNMAIQALRDGDIESALVGGVSLFNGDSAFQMFEQRGILSRESSLHLFDGRANGTVLGEGAGMVWLKTLDQALRDGDTIHAVIRGIAINNDGRTAGPAAPNLSSQKEVMQRALARSGLAPAQIEHIEVNGSGTLVTDLLELKAIEAVYRSGTSVPCELGSVKPNIGHPLCAEGIASFIKGVLTLHRQQRVPFLSATEPMAHYDLAASPFRFARALSERGDAPSIVAVNCFADGGTNAHVILQAWHDPQQRAPRRTPLTPPSLNRVDCRAQVSGDGSGDGGQVERREAASLVDAAATGTSGARGGVWKRVVETV